MKIYNSWPNGQVPQHLQRTELNDLKALGYEFDDAREVIDIFEKKVARFAGSKYAVTTDCCTHALELSLRYLLYKRHLNRWDTILIPTHTYISIYMMLKQLDFHVEFEDKKWSGCYRLGNTRVYDGAVRWNKGMYVGVGALQCISFQIKKRIPIGRGGMILCDSKEEYEWFKLARYDGRDMNLAYDHPDHIKMSGYHYYLTPEDCARGIILMDQIKEEDDTGDSTMYPNVKEMMKL